MTPLSVAVIGIGAWTPTMPGWPAMQAAFRDPPDDRPIAAQAATRPVPLLLPAAERRRVPDGVAVALEVAREAIAAAAAMRPVDTSSLASVFASAHGELAIVDYLCATLAEDPLLLSPTRFHHSVHNAAAGYWSIATPSVGPSTSIAAGDASFALGLLEAATQVVVDGRPVLLVVFDTPGVGLLARAAPNTALFGAALLLAPPDTDPGAERLSIAVESRSGVRPASGSAAFDALATSSPAAGAVALLASLASGVADDSAAPASSVDYPIDAESTLSVRVLGQRAARPTVAASTVA